MLQDSWLFSIVPPRDLTARESKQQAKQILMRGLGYIFEFQYL